MYQFFPEVKIFVGAKWKTKKQESRKITAFLFVAKVVNQSPKQRIDGTAALLDCYVGLYEHYNEYTGAIQ